MAGPCPQRASGVTFGPLVIRRLPELALVWVAAGSLALGACIRTPQSLCQETLDALNEMAERCGRPGYEIVRPSDGATGCGAVQRVTRPDELVEQCIPWTQAVACEDVPESLPAFCASSHFQYVE